MDVTAFQVRQVLFRNSHSHITHHTLLYSVLNLVLPDSTATDLDQHLNNLVGSTPTSQMTHPSLLTGVGTTQTSITSSSLVNGTNGIHVPRYLANANTDYHTSQNGPRSLSDSSQAESPVQDDLLTSNTPNLGGTTNQNFAGLVVNNQSQNSYGNNSSNCNGSLYPVLPASLLYSQLYTAANQSHGFHTHTALQSPGQNSLVHGELQTVMEHISTVGGGRGHQQQQLMAGTTDLSHCGNSARQNDEVSSNRQVVAMVGQRAQHHSDNGNSVWRPY